MYLIVFVGVAWLLTAPAMGILIGKAIKAADGAPRAEESLFDFLEADLRRSEAHPAARHR